jgi:hypothetical protein
MHHRPIFSHLFPQLRYSQPLSNVSSSSCKFDEPEGWIPGPAFVTLRSAEVTADARIGARPGDLDGAKPGIAVSGSVLQAPRVLLWYM